MGQSSVVRKKQNESGGKVLGISINHRIYGVNCRLSGAIYIWYLSTDQKTRSRL